MAEFRLEGSRTIGAGSRGAFENGDGERLRDRILEDQNPTQLRPATSLSIPFSLCHGLHGLEHALTEVRVRDCELNVEHEEAGEDHCRVPFGQVGDVWSNVIVRDGPESNNRKRAGGEDDLDDLTLFLRDTITP